MNTINKHWFLLLLFSSTILFFTGCQQKTKQAPKATATKATTTTTTTASTTKQKKREGYKDADPSAPYKFQDILFEAVPYEKSNSYKLNRAINDPTMVHKRLFYTEGDRRKGGEGLLRDGKPEGLWVWYHEDEKLQKKQEVTFVNGKEEGIQKSWYWNGQQRSEQEYKNGVRHGKRTTWKEDGGLLGKKTYENGEVVHSERH